MKFAVIFSSALLLGGPVFADVFFQAKQQAHHAADQPPANNPPGAAKPSAPQTPPMDPALAATLQNIASLRDDLKAINDSAQPDAALKIALLNDLIKAAQGTKPASSAVQKLAGHLSTALAGKIKLEREKLARELHALFNSAHLSETQQKSTTDDLKKILTDAGVSADDVNAIADDLQTISTATK